MNLAIIALTLAQTAPLAENPTYSLDEARSSLAGLPDKARQSIIDGMQHAPAYGCNIEVRFVAYGNSAVQTIDLNNDGVSDYLFIALCSDGTLHPKREYKVTAIAVSRPYGWHDTKFVRSPLYYDSIEIVRAKARSYIITKDTSRSIFFAFEDSNATRSKMNQFCKSDTGTASIERFRTFCTAALNEMDFPPPPPPPPPKYNNKYTLYVGRCIGDTWGPSEFQRFAKNVVITNYNCESKSSIVKALAIGYGHLRTYHYLPKNKVIGNFSSGSCSPSSISNSQLGEKLMFALGRSLLYNCNHTLASRFDYINPFP